MKRKILVTLLSIISIVCFIVGCNKVNNVTLTFMVDSESYASIETTGAESITIPNDPQKEGYTFDSWYWDKDTWQKPFTANSLLDTPIKSNLSVYAKFDAIEYAITYNANGGTHQNASKYTIENEITLQNAEKKGYAFDGWYNGETKVTKIVKGSTGDLNLTAKWTKVDYTITYENLKGATNSNPSGYNVESEKITLAPLSLSGYTFDGWYNGETKVTEIATGSTGNLTLTARWTENVYDITYHNVENAINSNPTSFGVSNLPITLVDAEKQGYTFVGWFDSETEGNKVETIENKLEKIDLYARWEIVTYYATFMADGEQVGEKLAFNVENMSVLAPQVPSKENYFSEWEDYTLTLEDITINALYTPITYTISYLNTKEATNSNETSYTIESQTITLRDISAEGYTFEGWYNGKNEKVEEIASGSFGNIELTAKWTVIDYTLTFIYDDAIGSYEQGKENKATYTIEDTFNFEILINDTIGYTFNGWYTQKNLGAGEKVDGISAGTTGDKIYYAQWGIKTFTITYHNVNGATNTNATTYTIETDTFEIENISRVGYDFNGWYEDEQLSTLASTTISKGSVGDIDLYAKWTAISYSIDYVLYGGTYENGSNPLTYTIEDEITFVNPSLTGYEFAGWFTLSEGGELVTGISLGTTGNKTFYARFGHISTISFETNGGSAVDSIIDVEGEKITQPQNPTKDYYEFAGWYSDEALTTAYSFNVMPRENITLYAKWAPVVYEINYVLNGGENNSNNLKTYTVEDEITLLDPTKTGYTFIAWFSDDKFESAPISQISVGTHGDITLYANYTINKYTISFNSNGGTDVEAIEQHYATEVSAPNIPAKNGYSFAGWYSNESLTKAYTFTTMPAENITLYAKWSVVTYNITYNLNGGTNSNQNPNTYKITSSTITLSNPTKSGYEFVKWVDSQENPVTGIEQGSYGDKEFTAIWQVKTYSIAYVLGDERAVHENPTEYTIETDIFLLADPIFSGYTFNGWFSESSFTNRVTTLAGGEIGDKTVYAKFTANTYDLYIDGEEDASYSVSFNLCGGNGEIATQQITETNAIVYPEKPTRDGYIFAGWYDNAEYSGKLFDFTQSIVKDYELFAKWIEVKQGETVIEVNQTKQVSLNGTNEITYVFVPLVSGNVSISSSGTIDTLGSLYNSQNVLIAQDDDTKDQALNFLMVYNVTAGKPYYIKVRAFGTNVTGNVNLILSGETTVLAGGLGVTPTKTQVTFDGSFTLPIPAERDGYKFLGYMDENGTMYTDNQGVALKVWDKAENSVLYSNWERMVYELSFNTGSGSKIDSVSLAFGERIDINEYVTTRSGYSFDCWLLDGKEFNASTMPDHAIELTAKWTTFTLGSIKYNVDKKAVSIYDEITADLFEAFCMDTDGKEATYFVEVEGNVSVGSTITVYITAESGTKSKYVTIENVKIYGDPTLSFDDTVTYFNLKDGLTASWFNASGLDTFGEATQINVFVDGGCAGGDVVTVTIQSIDPSGNITEGYVENVMVYDLPQITYNEDKNEISVNDEINASLFSATAVDSFGKNLEVTVTQTSGTFASGNTITLTFSATDEKGNTKTFTKQVKVYGLPQISNATTTEFKVEDEISPISLGLTSVDTYNNELEITLTVKEGTQTAGSVMVFTATVTDVAGNVQTKDISVKIYGTPTISYDKSALKVTEDPTLNNSILNATAVDSFGNPLIINISTEDQLIAGTYVVYTLTATDHLGNEAILETAPIAVYDEAQIELSYNPYDSTLIKLTSCGEEFSAEATDSFGNPCTLSIESTQGFTLTAGQTINLYIVATDAAGNKKYSNVIEDINVYGMPTVEYKYDAYYMYPTDNIRRLWTITDSFGEQLTYSATQTQVVDNKTQITIYVSDDANNVINQTFEVIVLTEDISVLQLIVNGEVYKEVFVTNGESFVLDSTFNGYTFNGWKFNGSLVTDSIGESLAVWDETSGYYQLVADITMNVYTVTYNLNGGINNSQNPVSYTIEALGGEFGVISLQPPTKVVKDVILSSTYLSNGQFQNTVERTEYTFLGWFTNAEYSEEVFELSLSLGSVELFAKWSETTSTTTTTTVSAYQRINSDGTINSNGEYILFGSYPQTKVSDTTTINSLNALARTKPTSSNSNAWTSYGYYVSGTQTNFMWYIDKEYNGETYRGVYFTQYRPYYTTSSSSGSNTYQDDNGYTTSTAYWFKYEPLKWRILTQNNGNAMLLCESIIDSQQYDYDGSYSNNYANSTIRSWLNKTFYETAFTSLQQELINVTIVDNSARSTNPYQNASQWNGGTNAYACSNTQDKVFLLSQYEVTNPSYGFSTYSTYDSLRQKKNTDYAKVQGCFTSTTSGYEGNGFWRLRSPLYNHSDAALNVSSSGNTNHNDYVNHTDRGVVPALWIRL